MLKAITTIQLHFSTIVQRCISRNQRMNFRCILILSIAAMIFIGAMWLHLVPNSYSDYVTSPSIKFDDIKIDPQFFLRKRIMSNKQSLATHQRNESWQQEIQNFLTRVSPHFQNRSICANHWAVVVEYSENIPETAKQLPNWCIVLVFDGEETIPKLPENIFVLNGTVQYELAKISAFYKESLQLPKGLYSVQKNLGYLWAIFHEATMIWDFDNTNEVLVNQRVLFLPLNETINVLTVPNHNSTLLNPYAFFALKVGILWSRGYPFQAIKDSLTKDIPEQASHGVWPAKKLALVNSLIEGYLHRENGFRFFKPDLPLHLKNISNDTNEDVKLIVPRRIFSPYDQQTTLHFRPALWALFLPATVHQQVTDIVRSYVMQRLMWDVDLQIAFVGSFLTKRFTGPGVEETRLHVRKSETARQTEKALFWEIDKLIQFLTQWLTNQKNFIERAQELFVALHEHGYIKMLDVYLLQLWLQELYQIGYIFPEIVP